MENKKTNESSNTSEINTRISSLEDINLLVKLDIIHLQDGHESMENRFIELEEHLKLLEEMTLCATTGLKQKIDKKGNAAQISAKNINNIIDETPEVSQEEIFSLRKQIDETNRQIESLKQAPSLHDSEDMEKSDKESKDRLKICEKTISELNKQITKINNFNMQMKDLIHIKEENTSMEKQILNIDDKFNNLKTFVIDSVKNKNPEWDEAEDIPAVNAESDRKISSLEKTVENLTKSIADMKKENINAKTPEAETEPVEPEPIEEHEPFVDDTEPIENVSKPETEPVEPEPINEAEIEQEPDEKEPEPNEEETLNAPPVIEELPEEIKSREKPKKDLLSEFRKKANELMNSSSIAEEESVENEEKREEIDDKPEISKDDALLDEIEDVENEFERKPNHKKEEDAKAENTNKESQEDSPGSDDNELLDEIEKFEKELKK